MVTIRKCVIWSLVNGGMHPDMTEAERKLNHLSQLAKALIKKDVLQDGWSGAYTLVSQLRDACCERWPELLDVPAENVGDDAVSLE
jgi:hypothetical protein